METALRWRIEKAQKEIVRLEAEISKSNDVLYREFLRGQIVGHQMEIGTLEDMILVHEHLENQKKLREVI